MRVTRGCGVSQPLSRSFIGSVINDVRLGVFGRAGIVDDM